MRLLRLREVTPVFLGCTAVELGQDRDSLFWLQPPGPPVKPQSPRPEGREPPSYLSSCKLTHRKLALR